MIMRACQAALHVPAHNGLHCTAHITERTHTATGEVAHGAEFLKAWLCIFAFALSHDFVPIIPTGLLRKSLFPAMLATDSYVAAAKNSQQDGNGQEVPVLAPLLLCDRVTAKCAPGFLRPKSACIVIRVLCDKAFQPDFIK